MDPLPRSATTLGARSLYIWTSRCRERAPRADSLVVWRYPMSLFLNPRSVVLLSAVSLLTSAGCASTSGGTGKPSGDAENVHVGLLVRLEAKPGKEADVQKFLEGGLPIVRGEPATTHWYALRLSPTRFGIVDTFPGDEGRQAHLNGQVAAALMAKSPDLLAKPPAIEQVDVLAAKP